MGCAGCSTEGSGEPKGCKSNGGCSTGGCNRLNTFDWLSSKNFYDPSAYNIVEVSFKNGARKGFFWKDPEILAVSGDYVVVDTGSGSDVGKVTLSGDLVRLQMKKKRVKEDRVVNKILREASDKDIEKMQHARELEKPAMVRARVIARTLELNMKVGDVEYQSDQRKATFYYTADGRVDFRELVRQYAKEFRVKIEMRQIGSRQESGRIGGIGSCGRELCCSTWLTDFKSVNTTAARYQNLAINQAKLSGQCGRLKCCLNYELDTYIDALSDFPDRADSLKTKVGKAVLIKTDIFKGLMYYAYLVEGRRGPVMPVDKEVVKKILALNAEGEFPDDLTVAVIEPKVSDEDDMLDFADVTGEIELPEEKKRKKRKGRRNPPRKKGGAGSGKPQTKANSGSPQGEQKTSSDQKSRGNTAGRPPSKRRKPRPPRAQNRGNDQTPNEPKKDNKG